MEGVLFGKTGGLWPIHSDNLPAKKAGNYVSEEASASIFRLESHQKSSAIPSEYYCLLVILPCKGKGVPAHNINEYVEVISKHS